MVGIDIADTIVVRRVAEKGTKIVSEKFSQSNWAGKSFKEYEKSLRRLVGNRYLSSAKGTRAVPIKDLIETQIPDSKGLLMSTGKGTGLRLG